MIEFINKHTGGVMWVEESRKEEYLEMGHKIAPKEIPGRKAPRKKPVKEGK